MSNLIIAFFCILIGYFIGNFSPAFLFGKTKGYDMRKEGSGNLGATNAFLLVGRHAFFITAALDILKAFLAWKICENLFPEMPVAGPLGGVACIIGHMYPVLLGFHGGKGLAALGGAVLAWRWQWFFLLLGIAILLAFGARYVCLVAPTMSLVFPGCYYWKTGFLPGMLVLLLPAVPIFMKHWENFANIYHGTEMRTSFIWDKEAELKRIGQWNEKTQNQLDRRG